MWKWTFLAQSLLRCSIGEEFGAAAVQRVLVGAGADFEPKIEQPLGVVFFVFGVLGRGQRAKAAGQPVRPAVDPHVVMIPRVGLEVRQVRDAGVVVLDGRRRGLADLIELVFVWCHSGRGIGRDRRFWPKRPSSAAVGCPNIGPCVSRIGSRSARTGPVARTVARKTKNNRRSAKGFDMV